MQCAYIFALHLTACSHDIKQCASTELLGSSLCLRSTALLLAACDSQPALRQGLLSRQCLTECPLRPKRHMPHIFRSKASNIGHITSVLVICWQDNPEGATPGDGRGALKERC